MRVADLARAHVSQPLLVRVDGLPRLLRRPIKLDVLPPHQTPDGRWHMVLGLGESLWWAHSSDGLRFQRLSSPLASGATAPGLVSTGDGFGLAYVKLAGGRPVALALRRSLDLRTWSPEREVLLPSAAQFKSPRGRFVSDVSLLAHDGGFRLGFGAGAILGPAGHEVSQRFGTADAAELFGPYQTDPLFLAPASHGAHHRERAVGAQRLVALDDAVVSFGLSLVEAAGRLETVPVVRVTRQQETRLLHPALDLRLPAAGLTQGLAVRDVRGRFSVFFSHWRNPSVPFGHAIFRLDLV